MKKAQPPVIFLAAILLMAALHALIPLYRSILFPWSLIGLAPLVAGVALNLLADRSFKKLGTSVKPFEESSALATEGVFKLSRNPMYLGMILILAGIAVLMGSATPWIVVPVVAVLFDRLYIKAEERMLERTFGDEYREYRRRVPRWV